jgi:hypothetical protein
MSIEPNRGHIRSDRTSLNVLRRIRLLALRRHVLYKVLSRVERALLYLATKVVIRVHSRVLADALNSIVKKLTNSMESTVSRQMKLIGVPLARKMSRIAQNWGNANAAEWANDCSFIRYLAVTWSDHALGS